MQPHSKSIHLVIVDRFVPDLTRKTKSVSGILRARAIRAWLVVQEWACRWRSRRELRSLSQREISDFCPKLTEALHEAEKPFWHP
jgi:uncharacterized protein YjiS (DUF1127 family)